MNKNDLIAKLAEKTETSKAAAKTQVETVLELIAEAIAADDTVDLPGFGKFTSKVNPAKKGRNPATGAEMDIAAKKVAKFAPAKGLKDRLKV
ncbi:HU family DNA-binding protein [Agrobacterium rubi]|nr:HU family DNA-binding protein [Agrobacterium rubi]NTF24144.1 HU family DNA-binding protein [Agrobacterium rubi]